jgi:hypothetical protein
MHGWLSSTIGLPNLIPLLLILVVFVRPASFLAEFFSETKEMEKSRSPARRVSALSRRLRFTRLWGIDCRIHWAQVPHVDKYIRRRCDLS